MNLPRQVWGLLTPAQRRAVLLMQLVSLLMAFATVMGVAAIAPFFSVLGDPTVIRHNAVLHELYLRGGFSSQHAFTVALGLAFVTIVLGANLLGVVGLLAMSRLSRRIGSELQTRLFAAYLDWPYAAHIASNSTTLFNNVIYETTRLAFGILQSVFVLVTNAVTAALIIATLFYVRALPAMVMVSALGGCYALMYLTVRIRLSRIGRNHSRFAREQARVVTESLDAIRDVITLRAQEFFREKFARSSESFLLAASQTQVVAQTPRYAIEFVAAAVIVGLALTLREGPGGVGGLLGLLTFFAFSCYRLLPSLQQVFASLVRIRADRTVLELVGADLCRVRAAQRNSMLETAFGTTVHATEDWGQRPRDCIELQRVNFRYAPRQPWALRSISMRIPARSSLGIVGANGSGKSTLMDVLAGLLVPESGSLEVDGRQLDEQNRAAWRQCIAYVPARVSLLDASIAENIAFGIEPEKIDQAQLLRAAELAQLNGFVTDLPQRYRQRIGQQGCALSGGQRQRIGIARALYRNASVLLLDEATSALDGLTEQELMATLARLRGQYTIVVVAHRMSSVRRCDCILHLDQGGVIGSGTYDQLLHSSTQFRRIAELR